MVRMRKKPKEDSGNSHKIAFTVNPATSRSWSHLWFARLLMVMTLVAVFSGCTLPKAGQQKITLKISRTQANQKAANQTLMQGPSALSFPSGYTLCFAVNVMADDIPGTQLNSCTPKVALHAGFVPENQEMVLMVPQGTGRKFEIFSYLSQDGTCPATATQTDLEAIDYSRVYAVGEASNIEISGADVPISITANFPGSDHNLEADLGLTSCSGAITPPPTPTPTPVVLPNTVRDFDFTTASLPSELMVQRSSPAKFTNGVGLLDSVSGYMPRFAWDTATQTAIGLLVEPSSTNELTYSDQFNTNWVMVDSTLYPGMGTSPTVANTPANRVVDNDSAGSNISYVYQSVPGLPQGYYSASVYVHADTSTQVALWVEEPAVMCAGAKANVVAQTSGPLEICSSQSGLGIEPMANGWVRLWVSFYHSSPSNTIYIKLVPAWGPSGFRDDTYTGAAYFWGAQLEQGMGPSTYISSLSAPTTRDGDIVSFTTTSFMNLTGGAIAVEAGTKGFTHLGNRGLVGWYQDTLNSMDLLYQASLGASQFKTATTMGQGPTLQGASLPANVMKKFGFSYDGPANTVVFGETGTAATATTTPIPPSLNTLYLGCSAGCHDGLAEQFNGVIKRFQYYNTPLTPAQMDLATAP